MSDRYRLLAEHAAYGAALLDEDGRVLYANPRMAELLHVPLDELEGANGMALLAAARNLDVTYAPSELDGARVQVVSAHPREHGEERFRRLLANLPAAAWETDWSGIMDKLRADGIDSIEKLNAIIESDPKYFGQTAARVRVLAVNRAALELGGVSDRAAFQKWITTSAFTHEMAIAYVAAVAPVIFQLQRTGLIDVTLRRAAGEHVDLLLHVAPNENWAEKPSLIVSALDVTERKRAEEKFRRLFMNLPVAAWESDWSGVIDYCARNDITTAEAFENMVGTDAERFHAAGTTVRAVAVNPVALDLLGVRTLEEFERWNDGYSPEAARRFAAAAAELLFGPKRTVSVELELQRADGKTIDLAMQLARGDTTVVTIAIDMTERKKSEEKYQRLFNSLPVAAWETDWSGIVEMLRGSGFDSADKLAQFAGDPKAIEAVSQRERILAVNQAALELMGGTQKDDHHRWRAQAFTAESARSIAAAVGPLLFGERRTVTLEMQLRRLDGQVIDTLARFSRAENWERDRTVFAVAIDVSEAKRAKRALVASKAYVDSLIDTANVLIVELDLDAHPRRMNRMGEEITGYKREELRNHNWFRALAPPDFEKLCDEFMVLLRGGQMPVSNESPLITRDGRERIIGWRNTNIYDERGLLTGVLCFGVDITARLEAQAEQERLQNEIQLVAEEWRRTFDTVNTPILLTDSDGLVMRANRAAVELTGRRVSEIVARPISSIHPGEPWQTAAQLVKHLGSEGYDTTAETRDGNGRTWDLSVSHFESGVDEAPRVIVVLWEITSVVELQESLRRSETMSAMGAIVAGVAHEIRNPLFGISATLDAYAAELSGYGELAGSLRREVNRLTTVTQELLDYGKPSALQIARGDLRDVVDSVARRAVVPRGDVAVDNAVPRELPPLLMDSARMRQVFENLIDNAMQHAPAGGTVRVSAAVAENAGRNWVECRVEDNGPGFAMQDLDRVFEPFYTKRQGGTGLGLSIVQRIVQEHSGKVSAGNRTGGGAAVTILLPIAG